MILPTQDKNLQKMFARQRTFAKSPIFWEFLKNHPFGCVGLLVLGSLASAASGCRQHVTDQQRFSTMFQKLLRRIAAKSFRQTISNRRRRSSERQRMLETLERRDLFAADSFVGVSDAGTWRLDGQAAQVSYGLTGETWRTNTLGTGIAVSGTGSIAAKTLPRGVVVNDAISRASEVDRFQFRANGGERFQLSLATANPSNVLSVRIIRPDGGTSEVILTVSGVRQTQFTIPGNLTGNYIVEVRARNGATTGQYRIGLESISTPSPNAVALNSNSLITGTLREPIQVDQYRVQGRPGERIQLRIADLNPASGPLKVTVFKPGGASKTGVLQVNGSRQIEFWITNTEAGTYLVHVEARNGLSTGQYRLQMQTLTPTLATSATVLRSGTTRTENIQGPVQSKQFLIDVRPNQRIDLQLTQLSEPANFKPRITLYNSAGNIVRSIVVGNGTGTISIPTHPTMGSRLLVQIEDSSLVSTGSVRLQYRLT